MVQYLNGATNTVSWNPVPTGHVQGICPTGWHIPTGDEWTELTTYVSNNGHSGTEGTALKSTSGWNSGGNGTDNFGFTGLPAGFRSRVSGGFDQLSSRGMWWSSTDNEQYDAVIRSLAYNSVFVIPSYSHRSQGHSVRCLQD